MEYTNVSSAITPSTLRLTNTIPEPDGHLFTTRSEHRWALWMIIPTVLCHVSNRTLKYIVNIHSLTFHIIICIHIHVPIFVVSDDFYILYFEQACIDWRWHVNAVGHTSVTCSMMAPPPRVFDTAWTLQPCYLCQSTATHMIYRHLVKNKVFTLSIVFFSSNYPLGEAPNRRVALRTLVRKTNEWDNVQYSPITFDYREYFFAKKPW